MCGVLLLESIFAARCMLSFCSARQLQAPRKALSLCIPSLVLTCFHEWSEPSEIRRSDPLAWCYAEISGQECSTSGREYLAYFMHRHLDFRLAEVDSLMEGLGLPSVPSRWREPYGGQQYSPFWYLTVPSDEVARQLMQKSILLKASLQELLCVLRVPLNPAWYCASK